MDVIVHRCRLFEFTPCAIHSIVASDCKPEIAVSRSNGDVEIWSVAVNCFLKMIIPGTGVSIEALVWIGPRLVSAGINGEIIEYDISCANVKISVDSFGGAVWCLCASNNQNCLAAGCEDGSIRLFNLENNSIKYNRALDKQQGRILSIAWHNDGDVLATGSIDIIRLWSLKTGHAIQKITIDRMMNNVATIVWSIKIMNDYTVVSGDSNGKVNFWNGKNGTLLKSFRNHHADVLTLCFGKNENFVFSSGVDAKLCEYVRLSSDNLISWVSGRINRKQTHDIRALASNKEYVFSGGIDTFLVRRSLANNEDSGFKILSFPSNSLVSFSKTARLMMFQYFDHLEVWSIADCINPICLKNGEALPIEKPAAKLIQINKSSSDLSNIRCSAMSSCGMWVAYSTITSTRLYAISSLKNMASIKVFKISCTGLDPAHAIAFTPDSKHLILTSDNHKLLFVKLRKKQAKLINTIFLKNTSTITHLLAVSSDSNFIACSDLDGKIMVFSLNNIKCIATIPHYQQVPTAMSFLPCSSRIMLAYADMQVLEYDVIKKAYTAATKRSISHHDIPILRKSRMLVSETDIVSVITSIFHVEKKDQTLLSYLVSSEGMYVMEQPKSPQDGAIVRFTRQFFPLLYAGLIDSQSLLLVERPGQTIFDQLPPTLQQKKFGV